MKPSPGSAEQRWWFRHAWITVTACGLLGASILFAVVRSMMSDEPLGGSWFFAIGASLPGVGLILATMAGFLLGVLGGVLLIRGRRGSDIECPRCGTFNAPDAAACSACSLPLG
jgi:hypothetical protein